MPTRIELNATYPSPGLCVLSVAGEIDRDGIDRVLEAVAVTEMRCRYGLVISFESTSLYCSELPLILVALVDHSASKAMPPLLIVPPQSAMSDFMHLASRGVLAQDVPAALTRIDELHGDLGVARPGRKRPTIRALVAARQRMALLMSR